MIAACASSSPAFQVIYSAYKLNMEQPHVKGVVAVWAQEAGKELLHVQG